MSTLRDAAAITGVGWTEISKKSGRSALSLGVEASLRAIEDAGLRPTDIDGLVTYYWGVRDTPAPAELGNALGLTDCTLSHCDSGGGAWACSAIAAAAAAVATGQCRNVLVYRAANSRSEPPSGPGLDFWPSGQRQWSEPYGAAHAATLYGPYVSAWMHEFGIENADFAPLAVLQRANAGLNRKALMTASMTTEQHQDSPWIVWPFRLLDCSIWNDGAMAVVVSLTSEATRMRRSAVSVRAVQGGSLGAPVMARTASRRWELNALSAAPRLYEKAGITVDDLDLAQIYDPFTGMAMLHIEQFGLAPLGAGPARLRAGDFSLDGRLPVNASGGNLSEGHFLGLGHIVEAVQQLRDDGVCDDYCDGAHDYDRNRCRQVRDPELALVVAESGDSSMILRRHS
ncbi:lipid-transfer protein [Leifsonia kafniensis]|uniref:Lipid-transfer protein n=1 Tax=Leifsonia kafniensis TaxID=475957 RepID=A0ABP7KXF1_9MICO